MKTKPKIYVCYLLLAAMMLPGGFGCWKKAELQVVNLTKYLDVPEGRQEEIWELIRIQGEVAGYRNTILSRLTEDGEAVYQVSQEDVIVPNRLGVQSSGRIETVVRQKRDGTFLQGDIIVSSSGQPMLTQYRPDPESYTMIRQAATMTIDPVTGEEVPNADPSKRTLPWKPGTLGPFAKQFSLWDKPLAPGEQRTFEYFDLLLEQPVTVELVADKMERLLYNNVETNLLPVVETTRIGEMTITSHLWMDGGGNIVKTTLNEPYSMELSLSTQEKVESAIQNAGGVNPILFALVRVQGSISQPRTTQKVEFQLHRVNPRGSNVPVAGFLTMFPTTAFQSVSVVDENTLNVTVTASSPQVLTALYGSVVPPAPKENTVPGDTLRNEWIQSDSEAVEALAAAATKITYPSWDLLVDLERFVSQKMQRVNYQYSFASAAEVAETLQGDSAGYAVLLAAIARVKKIPARVVVGLVYTNTNMNEGVFVPHFWTELFYDGHWHPFDATISQTAGPGGADASRIVLARSNLADESLPALVAKILPLLGHLQVAIKTGD